jgi:hypothetical protein
MPPEAVLVESRAMRDTVVQRVEVLDKVKALQLLPDGMHVTAEGVAAYFEIHRQAVDSVVRRHQEELLANGMCLLQGSELQSFETVNLTVSKSATTQSYPQGGRRKVRVFPRRAVLNVAMLLRDSDVARRVRAYLLDAEESGRSHEACVPRFEALEARMTAVESQLHAVGASLQELGPLLARMLDRLDQLDRRLTSTNQVLAALSDRVHRIDQRLVRVERVLLRQTPSRRSRRRLS